MSALWQCVAPGATAGRALALTLTLALALTLAALGTGLVARSAAAQSPGVAATDATGSAETQARERFEHGTALIAEGRFSEARVELEAALALGSRPPIAFNLVVAERGMGAFVDATRTCAELLAERHGPLDAARRAEAEELCLEVEANVAYLELALAGDTAAEARLDGVLLATIEPGETLSRAVDPGEHALALTASGREPLHRDVGLEPGEHLALELTLAPPLSARGGDDSALVLGLSIAGGALVLGGIVVAIVFATLPASSPAPPGDLPVTATLVGSGAAPVPMVRFAVP